MNINRAGKQTKAYWRSEQRHQEAWESEQPMTDAARSYGAYLIAQERVQGFAAGWIAGVAWAKREHRRSNAPAEARVSLRLGPEVGTDERMKCEGCGGDCRIDDMSKTHDDVWLCPGCWDSVCEEVRAGANESMKRGMVTYHVNCDCCSYNWTRRPMRGAFLRCKGCGRLVGDMDVSIVTPNAERQGRREATYPERSGSVSES